MAEASQDKLLDCQDALLRELGHHGSFASYFEDLLRVIAETHRSLATVLNREGGRAKKVGLTDDVAPLDPARISDLAAQLTELRHLLVKHSFLATQVASRLARSLKGTPLSDQEGRLERLRL